MTTAAPTQLELLNLDVGGEHFATPITLVQEIRVLSGLRKLPDAPEGWLGVIDFRDCIVPIIDLRRVFAAGDDSLDDKTVVVVVQVEVKGKAKMVGLVADAVSDVITIDAGSVKAPPDIRGSAQSVVTGLFKFDDQIIVLLDVEQLISVTDFSDIQTQVANANTMVSD